jgi:hypothetical protein
MRVFLQGSIFCTEHLFLFALERKFFKFIKKPAGNGQAQRIMETMDAGSVYVWAVRLRGDC